MGIQMVGIDYNKAGIDIREKFSFTKTEKISWMQELKKQEKILGCVILATCNRTELWISAAESPKEEFPELAAEGLEEELPELLCRCRNLSVGQYQEYMQVRKGQEAVAYLFHLSSGLKSQILGEDQVLTQVKEAISLSRECFCSDRDLEVLFRMAVTSGKKVKTKVNIPSNNNSAPMAAICRLEGEGYHFENKKCLVIGNGVMGKLSAQLLMERGADVTVTVRQYKSGIVDIPRHAARIDYGRRYEYMPECEFVFSATASPNITIRREILEKIDLKHDLTIVDLAVPRDVDTGVAELEGIRLLDMDYFQVDVQSHEMKALLRQADEILGEGIREFMTWYDSRDVVPLLLKLSGHAAQDVMARVEKPLQKANPENPKEWMEPVERAVEKVVAKLLFSIRDSVDAATFRECTEAMRGLYEEEERNH